MPVNAQTAKKLCNASEYKLYQAARARDVKTLTDAQLKSKIERSRKLRDKWRDESKRQVRESRGKAKPRSRRPSAGADNTKKKAQLFDEVLTKLQAETKRRKQSKKPKRSSAADKRTGIPKGVRRKRSAKSGKSSSAGKVKPGRRSKRAAKQGHNKKAHYLKAGTKRSQGHISSRGKRSQAARDTRTARGRG